MSFVLLKSSKSEMQRASSSHGLVHDPFTGCRRLISLGESNGTINVKKNIIPTVKIVGSRELNLDTDFGSGGSLALRSPRNTQDFTLAFNATQIRVEGVLILNTVRLALWDNAFLNSKGNEHRLVVGLTSCRSDESQHCPLYGPTISIVDSEPCGSLCSV